MSASVAMLAFSGMDDASKKARSKASCDACCERGEKLLEGPQEEINLKD